MLKYDLTPKGGGSEKPPKKCEIILEQRLREHLAGAFVIIRILLLVLQTEFCNQRAI